MARYARDPGRATTADDSEKVARKQVTRRPWPEEWHEEEE
jgi:hypothetical protein